MALDFLLLGAISLGALILATVLAGRFTVGRGASHPWRRLALVRVPAGGGARISGRFHHGRTHPGVGRYPERRND